jgi:hypothetical protein
MDQMHETPRGRPSWPTANNATAHLTKERWSWRSRTPAPDKRNAPKILLFCPPALGTDSDLRLSAEYFNNLILK